MDQQKTLCNIKRIKNADKVCKEQQDARKGKKKVLNACKNAIHRKKTSKDTH